MGNKVASEGVSIDGAGRLCYTNQVTVLRSELLLWGSRVTVWGADDCRGANIDLPVKLCCSSIRCGRMRSWGRVTGHHGQASGFHLGH